MALQRGRPEEIPEDAVLLSEQEAFFHQRDKLLNWPKSSEVYVFVRFYRFYQAFTQCLKYL